MTPGAVLAGKIGIILNALFPGQNMFWGDRLLTLDKSIGFREDRAFMSAIERADCASVDGDVYAGGDGWNWRYYTLVWGARRALKLDGDFVECGTYRGNMAWIVNEVVNIADAGKRFYLYDTFTGFDERYSSSDDFADPNFLSVGNAVYSDTQIEAAVRARFANSPHVIVTKGAVPDVLRERAPARIAFLHIDMNSPKAEVGALEVLFDRVAAGAAIIFDDYGWRAFRRQKDAIDAFMAAHGHEVMELPSGQGLVIKL